MPLSSSSRTHPHIWLAVGSTSNWKTAFANGNTWGLRPGRLLSVLWDVLREGDVLLFYAHKPVGGVVGYGTVKTKFKQYDKLLWPDEVKVGKAIYPLRFEFDIEFCLPPQRWERERAGSDTLKNLVRAGFQPIDVGTAVGIISELSPAEGQRLLRTEEPTPARPAALASVVPTSTHNEVRDMLVEIGRIQKFLAEPEYVMDGGRLDVVWRRVEKSVPTYVFEVQVGGDVYHALARLKHAFDLWNSHIFLVAGEHERRNVDSLLAGTFQ